MNRIDTNDVLFEKIVQDSLSKEDYFSIGKQLGESLPKIQKVLPGKNFYSLFEARVKDVTAWIESASFAIPLEESAQYCNFLQSFLVKNKGWFETELSQQVSTDGDFHTQNAIYAEGTLSLMDTFAPKEEWGEGHMHLPFYRIGLDIWGLSGNREFFDAFLHGYESGSGLVVNRKLDDVFIIYACCIAVTYLYMLQKVDLSKTEPAQKFHTLLRNYFAQKNLATY